MSQSRRPSPACQCNVIHPELLESVRNRMPAEEDSLDLSDFFRLFGDSTRIRILSVLETAEMCVCDLASLLSMTKSAVSHQLSTLRTANLVKYRRVGKEVWYSLDDEHVSAILDLGMTHLREGKTPESARP